MSSDSFVADVTAVRTHRLTQPSPSLRSLSRLEPSTTSPIVRDRAYTVHERFVPDDRNPPAYTWSPVSASEVTMDDMFEHEPRTAPVHESNSSPVDGLPHLEMDGGEELPIELLSLSDRFVDSLSAKVHSVPPTADRLSTLFQDFYELAASHISTHISMVGSRERLQRSRTPSRSSRSSSMSKKGARNGSMNVNERDAAVAQPTQLAQQMLTTAEIEQRRRARHRLERKRLRLEEAVERRVCEAVYDRVWRHRSTDDEERDEKLRSRTAALAVVGIGLKELGIEIERAPTGSGPAPGEDAVREWLATAREELRMMNDERCPRGKLQHLKAAHKGIVDTLSRLHPASSSADEILPTLIFTLITTPAQGINVISNLSFIQRFRTASKLDGEAAYSLTNLEAAISFLENVDIASLRASEASSGPYRPRPPPIDVDTDSTQLTGSAPIRPPLSSSMSPSPSTPIPIASHAVTPKDSSSSLFERPSLHQRSLSELLQPSTAAIGAASDAVLSRADQSFKTIGSTLESSYNVLFGRLRERQLSAGQVDGDDLLILPQTLDDARRLVSTPPPSDLDGLSTISNGQLDGTTTMTAMTTATTTTTTNNPTTTASRTNDRLLSFLGGTKMAREKSSESVKSSGSGKKVSFADGVALAKSPSSGGGIVGGGGSGSTPMTSSLTISPPSSATHLSPAMESMRSFGSSLNPLNRLAGMNAMLSFGRSSSSSPPPPPISPGIEKSEDVSRAETSSDMTMVQPDSDTLPKHPDLTKPPSPQQDDQQRQRQVKITPPIARLLELDDPSELKMGDVILLLQDYQRLARALRDLDVFETL